MKCSRCGAPFSWDRGCIVHVEGCPGVEVDAEVFGVGVAYIEPDWPVDNPSSGRPD